MQIVLTVVFLAFILGSLCDVVASLLHPPQRTIRLRRRAPRKRTAVKRAVNTEQQRWDIPIAM